MIPAMSPQIEKLATALSAAQKEIEAAPKNKTNPHFKSRYTDLDGCWAVARKPITAYGLSVSQFVSSDARRVTITTMLMHVSGQWLSTALTLEAKDTGPHAIGSAITYGRRYGFCAVLGITSDEDDDGNAGGTGQQQEPKKNDGGYKGNNNNGGYNKYPPKKPEPEPAAGGAVLYSREEHWDGILTLLALKPDDPVCDYLERKLKNKMIDRASVRESYQKALAELATQG